MSSNTDQLKRKTMFQYTQPNCRKTTNKLHIIKWDMHPIFEDDMVHFEGKCVACKTDFMKSFQSTGLTIIGKVNREVYNFNKEITELN